MLPLQDLTTSNMMLRAETATLVMIDFGLSAVSTSAEDKVWLYPPTTHTVNLPLLRLPVVCGSAPFATVLTQLAACSLNPI
jgi:hypothetical protein